MITGIISGTSARPEATATARGERSIATRGKSKRRACNATSAICISPMRRPGTKVAAISRRSKGPSSSRRPPPPARAAPSDR